MTTPHRREKNRSNLNADIPARVGLDVVAPTNVRAQQTDPSKIINALDQWRTIEAGKAEKAQAKATELSTALGYRDASLNKVDESQLSDDTDNSPEAKAYRKGVTAMRAEAHGLRFINESRTELVREAANPDFDYDEWRTGKLEQFYEASAEGQNPDALAMLNRYVTQFDQNMSSQHSAIKAKAEMERATNGLADNLSEMVSSGLSNPAQLAQWRATRAADSGLDDSEVEDVMGSVLLDKLTQGDTNAFALAEAAGLMKDHEWSTRFNQQKEATETRLERQRIDSLEADATRTLQVRQRLGTLADRGQLTIAHLAKLEEQGEITPSERNWAWGQQMGAERRRLREAEKAYAQRQDDVLVHQLTRSGQEEILRVTAGNPKLRRRVRDAMDQQYADGLTAALSDDPGTKEAGIHEMTRVMDQAQQNAMSLDYLKNTFDEADVGVPQRFESMGNLYRELVSQGKGDYLRNNISTTAYAKMERYRFLVENGSAPAEAVTKIADSPVKIEDATQQANFNGRLLQDQAEKLGEKLGVAPGLILPKLRQYAIEQYSFGATGEAVPQASKMFSDKYAAVGGAVVPRGWFPESNPQEPEEFATAWDALKDSVVIPKLREKYGDAIDDVELLPNPREPGEFFIRRVGDNTFIPGAAITSESLRKAHLQSVRDAQVKHQQINEDFRNRELPPL